MQMTMQPPVPDAQLSYSAGSTDLDPYRFRAVRSADGRFDLLQKHFPQLRQPFATSAPLVINCYPAALGTISAFPSVDTYLRPVTFSRAMLLAAADRRTPIIMGQPLLVIEMVTQHLKQKLEMPHCIVMFVGGYPLPDSGERYISELIARESCQLHLFHAYGVAELDFGFLIGQRTVGAEVKYKLVHEQIDVCSDNGELQIETANGKRVNTGDQVRCCEDGTYILSNSPTRFAPQVFEQLERWSHMDWKRRTGHAVLLKGELVVQLRSREKQKNNREMNHSAYFEQFASAWTEKPHWKEI